MVVMYGCIAAYSALVCQLGGEWWEVPVYYLLGMGAFYCWHWLAHRDIPLLGDMHRLHMRHHLKNYPPGRFYGKTKDTNTELFGVPVPTMWQLMDPRATTVNNLAHEGPLYVMMACILLGGRQLLGSSIATTALVLVGYLIMGVIGNMLHMSFHVPGFELERFSWYAELRALHYIHHLGDMRSNLAMLNLGMDGVFGSLAVTDPVPLPPEEEQAPASAPDVSDEYATRANAVALKTPWIASLLLGMDGVPLTVQEPSSPLPSAIQKGYPTVLLRLLTIAGSTWLWMQHQDVLNPLNLGNASSPWKRTGGIVASILSGGGGEEAMDPGHVALASFTAWAETAGTTSSLCLLSVVTTNAVAAVMIVRSVLGPSGRPALAAAAALLVKASLATLNAPKLCPPPSSLWVTTPDAIPTWLLPLHKPASVAGFLPMRVCLAAVAASELARGGRKGHALAGLFIVTVQAGLTVAFKDAWSFETVLALLVGRYASLAAERYARFSDAFIG